MFYLLTKWERDCTGLGPQGLAAHYYHAVPVHTQDGHHWTASILRTRGVLVIVLSSAFGIQKKFNKCLFSQSTVK